MKSVPDKFHFVADELYFGLETELPTADGGKLIFTTDEEIPYEFAFGIKCQDEEVDVLCSVVRLIDDRGIVWLGESIWPVSEIVGAMTDFLALSAPQKFSSLSSQAQAEFESECFFKGARGLLDNRLHRNLLFEGVTYPIQLKHQSPVVDLSFLENDAIARVRGLMTGADDPTEIPAVVFPVEVRDRLFVNYGYEDESGEWDFAPIPLPFILQPSGARSEPQPLIRYEKR
jgi:hypothetical protein